MVFLKKEREKKGIITFHYISKKQFTIISRAVLRIPWPIGAYLAEVDDEAEQVKEEK